MMHKRQQVFLIITAFSMLAIGVIMYLIDRQPGTAYFIPGWISQIYHHSPVFGQIGQHLPTFVHVYIFILLTNIVMAPPLKRLAWICFGWFMLDCMFEIAQISAIAHWIAQIVPDWFTSIPFLENTANYFQAGTFDFLDLVSIAAGAIAAYLTVAVNTRMLVRQQATLHLTSSSKPTRSFWLIAVLGLVSTVSTVGSGGGGGGGGTSVQPLVYSGNTDAAVISTTNAAILTANVLGGGDIAGDIGTNRALVTSHTQAILGLPHLTELITTKFQTILNDPGLIHREKTMIKAVAINITLACDNYPDGWIQVTGELSSSGLGTLSMQFSNCQLGEGFISGNAEERIDDYDLVNDIPIDYLISFTRLTLTLHDYSMDASGSIHSIVVVGTNTETMTINIVTKDNYSGVMTKAEELVQQMIYDNILFPLSYSMMITGRVFDSRHGYVDVTTDTTLHYSDINQLHADSGGSVVLTGLANASILATAQDEDWIMIELDIDGDTSYEIARLLMYGELAGESASDLADSDGDGIHDSWETVYGLNPLDGSDANNDSDGDWIISLVEYEYRTDPGDGHSYPANADDYDLDDTFGTDGVALFDDPVVQSNEEGRSVAIQSDGKIVVTGYIFNFDRNNVLALRYNSDGTLDDTFGTGGVFTYSECSGCAGEGYSVGIQTDGKIVIVGYTVSGVYDSGSILLLRLDSDGTLDATFGTGGRVVTNVSNYGDYGYDLALASEGKIVVTGSTSTGTDVRALVLRYSSSGVLDTTFDTDGIAIYDSPGWDIAEGVAVQSDGKIIVTGNTSDVYPNITLTDVLTLRYNTNGSLDSTFGSGGVVTYDNIYDKGHAVKVQTDGNIVVSGNSWDYACENSTTFLLRYLTNGVLDSTFGIAGVVSHNPDLGSCVTAAMPSLALRADGKIITAGYLGIRAMVIRYNTDGSLDTTFSREGYGTYTHYGSYAQEQGAGIALQADGKMLITGTSRFHDSYSDNAVLVFRLLAH